MDERLEYDQLMSYGAFQSNELIAFSARFGVLPRADESEEDFEVSLSTKVLPFLEIV